MQSLTFNSHGPEQTQLLGSYLGKLAQKADVLLLTGELGTGKTCLVQGIVFMARSEAVGADYHELEGAITKLLARAQLLESNE
ncbi:tRNA (adenosine(37)-N6)-threonylcarbamoyltransferase complex ATPase subunit type 1 TsaE [Chloroflexota bacterium]